MALMVGVSLSFHVSYDPLSLFLVGLPYTILLGIVCTLLITFNQQGLSKGGILTMGRRMVLQYYLGKQWGNTRDHCYGNHSNITSTIVGASVVGLIIIIGWIGKYGFNNRTAAGI